MNTEIQKVNLVSCNGFSHHVAGSIFLSKEFGSVVARMGNRPTSACFFAGKDFWSFSLGVWQYWGLRSHLMLCTLAGI